MTCDNCFVILIWGGRRGRRGKGRKGRNGGKVEQKIGGLEDIGKEGERGNGIVRGEKRGRGRDGKGRKGI